MNSGFECDIEKVFEQFCDLAHEEMTKAVKSALREGGKELIAQTKTNLTNELKHRTKNGKYKDKMEDAVRSGGMYEDRAGEFVQVVHIKGNREKGSGTFRAKFFEKGTRVRYNKKTHASYGRITPRWFFKNAQRIVFPKLNSIYMKAIDKAINKINNS